MRTKTVPLSITEGVNKPSVCLINGDAAGGKQKVCLKSELKVRSSCKQQIMHTISVLSTLSTAASVKTEGVNVDYCHQKIVTISHILPKNMHTAR